MAPQTSQAASCRPHRPAAFTLVELLVVIGIIAVLISILLPTLRSVRRQANLVQCSSNMKQIATAMIMYIQDNKGRHPPVAVEAVSPAGQTIYNKAGWWWANELVRQNYIKTRSINVYPRPGWNQNDKRFNRANPFRCPEGVDEDWAKNGSLSAEAGDYPTHAGNSGFAIINDKECATDGWGVPSWYMLNGRVVNSGSAPGILGGMKLPGGSQATPFAYFNDGTDFTTLQNSGAQRQWGQVKRSGELIMIVEATHPNFHDQKASTKYPGLYLRRLAARHGKVSRDGANAYTNLAFFDGHVGLYPTTRFNKGPNGEQWPEDYLTQETIFWVGKQK
jgi:prepilin-type N-terminal cleavage/methylation domain-containing protein/prepilin-type processing-associated H-X9-DG protein